MDRWSSRGANSQRRERLSRQKIKVCEKIGKPRNLAMFCGSGGPKSRLAKAAGAEPSGHRRDQKLHAAVARSTFWCQNAKNTSAPRAVEMFKKCSTPLWHEAHFEVNMRKTHHSWSTFGSCDVQKVHAVVARSTFGNLNSMKKYCIIYTLVFPHDNTWWYWYSY